MGIVIAKLLGFIREALFGRIYETSLQAEMYTQIFGLVTLLFTGIGVALSTQVIIKLNKPENSSIEAAKSCVSSFILKSIAYLSLVIVLLFFLAKPFTKLLFKEYSGELLDNAVKLTYIMLPSLMFVVIAYIISGVLQNNKVFFIPSIISLPSNIILIFALLGYEKNIYSIGILTTIGWFLHIIIQLPSFYKKGFRLIYTSQNSISAKKDRFNMNIWWIFISNMMFQLCFIIDRSFVSGNSGSGLGALLSYASTIFTTISSVFVVAMSSVVFPSISKNYEEGNIDYVKDLFGYIVTLMFFVFVPFILIASLFGKQIMCLVYNLSGTDAIVAGVCFTIYCLGILGYLAQELVNKVFYLASNYSFTVIGSVLVIIFKCITNSIFVNNSAKGAITATLLTTLLLSFYAIAAFIKLRFVIGNYLSKDIIKSIIKILISGSSALIVYFVIKFFAPDLINSTTLTFMIPILICGIVYIACIIALGLHKQLIRNPKKERSENN